MRDHNIDPRDRIAEELADRTPDRSTWQHDALANQIQGLGLGERQIEEEADPGALFTPAETARLAKIAAEPDADGHPGGFWWEGYDMATGQLMAEAEADREAGQ